MTFISYAQNYEDVMLNRALSSVQNGFYVDVGAQQPVIDSVTKAFYEKGWHGINIEPVPHWREMLEKDRVRDVNLGVAVGNTNGELTLYSVADTGLSTADPAFADIYRSEGRNVIELKVPVRTLTDILDEHGPSEIHFLKIDVEGFEYEVVSGLDLERYRPWVLVIESTLPNSPVERYSDWEKKVVSSGYHFVYFDGLNRFYVAEDHKDLANAFSTPPNVFDSYVRYSEWDALQKSHQFEILASNIKVLERKLVTAQSAVQGALHARNETRRKLQQKIDLLEGHLYEKDRNIRRDKAWLERELSVVSGELEALRGSLLFRGSAPFRFLLRGVRQFLRAPGKTSKVVIARVLRLLSRSRVIRFIGARATRNFPGLKSRLLHVVGANAARRDTAAFDASTNSRSGWRFRELLTRASNMEGSMEKPK